MPIYEYQCSLCGHQLEVLQKVSDGPLTECPNCKKSSLKKLISAASFQLKGTGWYATDFRNKDKPKSSSIKEGESNSSGSNEKDKSSGSKESSSQTNSSEVKSNEGQTS